MELTRIIFSCACHDFFGCSYCYFGFACFRYTPCFNLLLLFYIHLCRDHNNFVTSTLPFVTERSSCILPFKNYYFYLNYNRYTLKWHLFLPSSKSFLCSSMKVTEFNSTIYLFDKVTLFKNG